MNTSYANPSPRRKSKNYTGDCKLVNHHYQLKSGLIISGIISICISIKQK